MRCKFLILIPIFCGLLWSSSCRKDFEYAPSAGNLSFSRDTVYLDTVFSNIGSSTYTLKVYNDTRDDVLIPRISLKNGIDSFYRLNVDGVAGKSFNNVPIYAQDSLFIRIETTIAIADNETKELLYTDAIHFDTEPFQQSVELVTLVKDAIFLYPSTDTGNQPIALLLTTADAGNETNAVGFELRDTQLNFTNEKPYVIYGYGIIPSGKEAVIAAGARIYFHNESGLYVQDGASITINGSLSTDTLLLENEVIFEGDRLEPSFSDIPGQWGALWFSKGSTNNYIEHLTLKNATVGLYVEGNGTNQNETLIIKNSQIYNSGRNNLWAKNARLVAENLVLGGAGASSLRCENGGSYAFTHCTIANYWNQGFRTRAALELSNTSLIEGINGTDLIQADFINCIITGNTQSEISLLPDETNLFNYRFQNCFIKYNLSRTSNPGTYPYDFENMDSFNEIVLNGTTDFFFPSKNDFRIGLDSEVINKGDLSGSILVPVDLLGMDRRNAPDLGVYQAKSRPE